MSIQESWTRIETWLAAQAASYDLLGPPSSTMLGKLNARAPGLPSDFLESVALHNGQSFSADPILGGYVLLSIENLLKTIPTLEKVAAIVAADIPSSHIKADPGIRPMWWSEKWIPFAMAEPRDQLMIDLDPGSGGIVGQVIRYWGDDPRRKMVAPSFEAWLAAEVERLPGP